MPHSEFLWALQSLKMRLRTAYGFPKASREAQTLQRNRDWDLSSPVTYLLCGPSNFTKENLKSSSVSCTTLFSSSSFFFKSQRWKIISFQRFHLSDHPARAKRVQETSPKSKPKTHQRQKEEGGGEWKRKRVVRAGGATDCEPKCPGNTSRAEIYCTIYLLWLSHRHTHSRTLTHSLSCKSRHPALKHSRSHRPVRWKLSVVTSSRCCVLQMVRLTVTFPDRCRIKRTSQIRGPLPPRTR